MMGSVRKIIVGACLLFGAAITFSTPTNAFPLEDDLSSAVYPPASSLSGRAAVKALRLTKGAAPAVEDVLSGSNQTAKGQVLTYLEKLGYIADGVNLDLTKPSRAVKELQRFGGVPQTGVYNNETQTVLEASRCGVKDTSPGGTGITPRFAPSGKTWDHTDLTYAFDNFCAELTQPQIRTAIQEAFSQWSAASVITFRELPSTSTVDFRISWQSGDHGDGSPFDGPGLFVGHASYPRVGAIMHFDDAEQWTQAYLKEVALHEVGHTLGLLHSDLQTAVMWPSTHGQLNLGLDDILGVQSLYGGRTSRWSQNQISGPGTVEGKGIASISRVGGHTEIFWITPDGSIRDAFLYEGAPAWTQYVVRGPGTAVGGITAISTNGQSITIFWISPSGSVEAGNNFPNQPWTYYQIAPAGSAAIGSKITALSRHPRTIEVWWVASDGSVKDAYWYEGSTWNTFTLAGQGSAKVGTSIAAVFFDTYHMDIFWIGPSGAIEKASVTEGKAWSRLRIAPAGSASTASGITATARLPNTLEVWWIAPDGSVIDTYWYEGSTWQRFQLSPPGSAALGGIGSVTRTQDRMDVWWITPNGAIMAAAVIAPANWITYQLSGVNTATPGSDISSTARWSYAMNFWHAGPGKTMVNHAYNAPLDPRP